MLNALFIFHWITIAQEELLFKQHKGLPPPTQRKKRNGMIAMMAISNKQFAHFHKHLREYFIFLPFLWPALFLFHQRHSFKGHYLPWFHYAFFPTYFPFELSELSPMRSREMRKWVCCSAVPKEDYEPMRRVVNLITWNGSSLWFIWGKVGRDRNTRNFIMR